MKLNKLGPEVNIQIVTPQFHRDQNDAPPGCAPSNYEQWEALRHMSSVAWREMGLRSWGTVDEDDKNSPVLYLLPGEWYQHIPKGFVLVDIFGNEELFKPGQTDDDIRFGCLSYGLLADKE